MFAEDEVGETEHGLTENDGKETFENQVLGCKEARAPQNSSANRVAEPRGAVF